jgi:hypothetical protein
MRMAFILAFATATAGSAVAGSIDMIKTGEKGSSVDYIQCAACAAEAKPPEAPAAPTLRPGEQKIEIRTVNGQKLIFRTEAWLGGSPVVMVSKAPSGDAASQAADAQPSDDMPPPINMIDRNATTSAVSADMGGPPPLGADRKMGGDAPKMGARPPMGPPPAQEEISAFDPSKLQMRIQ